MEKMKSAWVAYVPLVLNILLLVHAFLFRLAIAYWPNVAQGWKDYYWSYVTKLPIPMLVLSVMVLFVKTNTPLKVATIATVVAYIGVVSLFLHAFQYG